MWGETTPTSLNCFQHQNPRVFFLLAAAGIQNHSCAPNEAVFLGQSVVFCPNLPLNCLLLDKKLPRPQELGDKFTSMLSYILTPFPKTDLRACSILLQENSAHLRNIHRYIYIHIYTLLNFPSSLDFCLLFTLLVFLPKPQLLWIRKTLKA